MQSNALIDEWQAINHEILELPIPDNPGPESEAALKEILDRLVDLDGKTNDWVWEVTQLIRFPTALVVSNKNMTLESKLLFSQHLVNMLADVRFGVLQLRDRTQSGFKSVVQNLRWNKSLHEALEAKRVSDERWAKSAESSRSQIELGLWGILITIMLSAFPLIQGCEREPRAGARLRVAPTVADTLSVTPNDSIVLEE